MSIFFIFIDGVGLGKSSDQNPFSVFDFQGLKRLSGGQNWTEEVKSLQEQEAVFIPVDACFGMEGLPQSGTGQVTLFTGENASALAGKHYGPYPHSATRETLAQKSFFRSVLDAGKRPFFINAFPQRFFEFSEKTNRWSSSALMVKQCGLRLNTLEDVLAGKAVTAELFQDYWAEKLQLSVPQIGKEAVAQRFNNALAENDVVFLEYYLTDKAGHEQDVSAAERAIRRFDEVLGGWLDIRRPEDSLVLCSDHGNVEDLSVKTHTFNPVPLAVIGKAAPLFFGAKSLMDVKAPLVRAVFKG